MTVKEVLSPKELKAFVDFPKRLYKGCTHYVPPLDSSEVKLLTQHPALEFCSLRMWLAYENDEIVGRVAGIINHKCNELKQQKRIRFGWFDLVDDVEVARALLQKVEEWGTTEGLEEVCGPSRYSNMEKQSMLIEGFDNTPSIASDYNYPYYPQLIEELGFEKEVDYVQYRMKVNPVPPVIDALVDRVQQRTHVKLKPIRSKRDLQRASHEFFKVLNSSYKDIFNFIPLTDKEIDWAIDQNFAVADPELVSALEDENGRMVGIAFSLPSLSRAFQKANGKLFPFGWRHVLHALRHEQVVDLYLTGVLPEYIHSGIHAIYHKELNETFLRRGFKYANSSQQLENNVANRIWAKYDSELVFRRRCYKKQIK